MVCNQAAFMIARSRQSLVMTVLAIPVVLLIGYLVLGLSTLRPGTARSTSVDGAQAAYAQAVNQFLNTDVPPELAAQATQLPLTDAPTHTPSPTATVPVNPVHTVARGDTLSTIASFYGVTISEIASANSLTNINALMVGQTLIIPRYTPTETPSGLVTLALVTPIAYLTASPTPTPTPLESDTPTPTVTPIPPTPVPPTETPLVIPTLDPTLAVAAMMGLQTRVSPGDPQMLVGDADDPPISSVPTAVTFGTRGDDSVNGLSLEQYLILDAPTRQRVREIFALGQSMGRNPNAFAKVGDSTIESPYFMDRFDFPEQGYNLAQYAWLQPTIDWFSGSFGRNSLAVRVGLHTWSVLDPMWADPYQCESGETVLDCEFRIHNPSYVFIRLGSNDVGVPTYVENSMREIIEYCIANGVVPIVGTKADNFEGGDVNNEIFRRLAREYRVPLWDFNLLAGTIPGRGLGSDGTHMTTFYAHDWSDPNALRTGHGVHSIAGLIVLDTVMRAAYGF
jgi:LysM repeat protein